MTIMAELHAYIKHRVRKGENLSWIAQKYGLKGVTAWRLIYRLDVEGHSNRGFRESFPDENQIDYIWHGKPVFVWVPLTIQYEEHLDVVKAFPPQPSISPPQARTEHEHHVTLVQAFDVVLKADFTWTQWLGPIFVEQTYSWNLTIRTSSPLGEGATLDPNDLSKRPRSSKNAIKITGSQESFALDLFGKASVNYNLKGILQIGSGYVVAAIGEKGPEAGITVTQEVPINGVKYKVTTTGTVGFDEGHLTYTVKPAEDVQPLGLGPSTIKFSYKVLSRMTLEPAIVPVYEPAPAPAPDNFGDFLLVAGCVVFVIGAFTGADEVGGGIFVLVKVATSKG